MVSTEILGNIKQSSYFSWEPNQNIQMISDDRSRDSEDWSSENSIAITGINSCKIYIVIC